MSGFVVKNIHTQNTCITMRPSSQNKHTILDVIVKTIAMIYLIVSSFGFDMEFDLLYLLQKKDDYDVVTGMNYGVGSFSS